MRRDREDDLDLADVGGEMGAATHGSNRNVFEALTQAQPRSEA
jgi:hypothetical protein